MRFAGATYDPTSHYRAARVFDFFEEQGLDARGAPRELPPADDAAGRALRRRGAAREDYGGFVAVEVPDAEEVSRRLAGEGVLTDSRGRRLRLGPAPYVTDDQLERAADAVRRYT